LQENKWFSVSSEDKEYNSPMIGNGEVVTTVGPTGYQNGFCPDEEHVNRTIFWAGRRLKDARNANIRIPRVPSEEFIGPTIPLIRFGRLLRSLKIDGKLTDDKVWEQTMDFDKGRVLSTLEHGQILEKTVSMVCLTYNMLVFHTTLENQGAAKKQLEFTLTFDFGDADGDRATGTRLLIRRPHPDDLGFGNIEGTRSLETDLEHRPPNLLESLSVRYEIENHLGEVHVGRYPIGKIKDTDSGGIFTHQIELGDGESSELWFWMILSDRLKYTHFPEFERVFSLVKEHEKAWADFWNTSKIKIGNPKLEALRKSCLYTLRCNSSPWTLPPGYLSTHWEGRTFHDEFYPFMGLISSNYVDLAEKIPNSRLLTLPLAKYRSGGQGARFGWEVTETGEESAPYGHWVDEQFRHGQISEQAWRYYLHTGNLEDLERFYPVLKGCADWMIHDVLVRDENGRLRTRTIADISEHVISASNSIFVVCATIKTLDIAARASELLGVDVLRREKWHALANEMRQNLPVDEKRKVYRYADDTDLPPEPAHLGMVYPFSFDIHGDITKNTMDELWQIYQKKKEEATSEQVMSYNWIWAVARLATICFYQGLADKGYDVLNQAIYTVGPFMAPNEHYRSDKGPFLPWFATGAGALVYASNSMFVQVIDENGAILFPALPSAVKDANFDGLLTTHGVTVSGKIELGQVVELKANSNQELTWNFRIPKGVAVRLEFANGIKLSSPDEFGLQTGECKLKKGVNTLLD